MYINFSNLRTKLVVLPFGRYRAVNMTGFNCRVGAVVIALTLLSAAVSSGSPGPKQCSTNWGHASKDWIYSSIYTGKDVRRCPELNGAADIYR